jgi:hypothetical protein
MSNHKRKKSQPTPSPAVNGLWLAVGGLLIVGLAVFAWWAWSNSPTGETSGQDAPSLKVDREKIDLGNIPLGQFVQASFEVTNTGEQPLRFREAPYIRVAAGC